MRTSIFIQSGGQILEALTSGLIAMPDLRTTSYGPGVRRYPKHRSWDFVPAGINRHTGEPHENKREIAWRLLQAGRAS